MPEVKVATHSITNRNMTYKTSLKYINIGVEILFQVPKVWIMQSGPFPMNTQIVYYCVNNI